MTTLVHEGATPDGPRRNIALTLSCFSVMKYATNFLKPSTVHDRPKPPVGFAGLGSDVGCRVHMGNDFSVVRGGEIGYAYVVDLHFAPPRNGIGKREGLTVRLRRNAPNLKIRNIRKQHSLKSAMYLRKWIVSLCQLLPQ